MSELFTAFAAASEKGGEKEERKAESAAAL